MKRRITIVHGIHTNEDAGWMRVLAWAFERAGWESRFWTYGNATALLTRFQNPGRAQKLAEMLRPGEVVLGHSNGGCLAWMAAELGAPIGGAILLNPALDSDKVMAPQVKWVHLYPNTYDRAVPWAKHLFRCGHPWGTQGRDGLTVKDDRYKTVFTEAPKRYGLNVVPVAGHSAILAPDALLPWSDVIVERANAEHV